MRSYFLASPSSLERGPEAGTPWGAADLRAARARTLPRASDAVLHVAEDSDPLAYPKPADVSLEDLRSFTAISPPFRPEERPDLFEVVGYQRAATFDQGEPPPQRWGACLLWPNPAEIHSLACAAARHLWNQACAAGKPEPHASLCRKFAWEVEALGGLQQGFLDALWVLGFSGYPEVSNYPSYASLPGYVGAGYLPLGWTRTSPRRFALYPAIDTL